MDISIALSSVWLSVGGVLAGEAFVRRGFFDDGDCFFSPFMPTEVLMIPSVCFMHPLYPICQKMPVLMALFAVAFFSTSSARAAAITNLTDAPQTVELREGESLTAFSIAPGRTWRVQQKVVVRYQGRENRINEYEEFAIWKDGSFGPQRPNVRGGRNY
ncbi:MAG: hypothetical protein K2Q01_08645 [Rickettsiales bacterium]|nr:hypothetical protein [Rickettsiales bacterium]